MIPTLYTEMTIYTKPRLTASLRNDLRKKGELIGDFDLLMASTALVHKLVLLTENVAHHRKIKGLKIVSTS